MSSTLPDITAAPNATFAATVTVLDDFGLHARPAASLAKTAQSFECSITLSLGEQCADAKSILDILSLAAARNSTLTISCNGIDAKNAGEALIKLFEARFHLEAEPGL
ncbi:HPr family phosphocarrier protein [Desulfovibrio sp. OttesenSCG-928-F07]|nr:HPr family phosphocarrier protein [Desulfovibrio sp. OttesenSCG-928-F07]